MDELYDLIIIGAAAAGCSAAIYAARRNLNTLILTKDIGGEVALSGDIENWPSVPHTTGIELAQAFHKHVKEYDVPIQEGLEVTSITQKDKIHHVITQDAAGNEEIFRAKAVLVASGIHPRHLGIPGEEELKGRGVTYCTVCDGPLFKGKVTATVGAGNAALESALMMAELAEKVYLITKYGEDDRKGGFPKGENIIIDKAKAHEKIEIIYNANTLKLSGENMIDTLTYKDLETNEEKHISVNGVMVHIGMIPNSGFINCAEKNAAGEIEVDMTCRTSCPGIFAAGDVTNIPYKQISIAVGQGATAALSAIEYLNLFED